jgi:hypothetical protein
VDSELRRCLYVVTRYTDYYQYWLQAGGVGCAAQINSDARVTLASSAVGEAEGIVMPGVKLIALITRRRDLDLAAFSHHWRTTHRDLIMRLVRTGIIKGYVQNHRAEPQLDGLPIVADGSPELWIESPDDMARIGQSPEYMQGARLDEPNFMEGRSRMLLAQEVVIIDALGQARAAQCVKLMLFLRRAEGCSALAFEAFCGNQSRSLLMPDAKPLRLTQQRPLTTQSADPLRPIYDFAEFSWWPDRASLAAAWLDRKYPDEIDAVATSGVLVQEERCLLPMA